MRIALPLLCACVLAACGENTPVDEAPSPESGEPEAVIQPMVPGLYAVGDGSQVYAQTRLNEDGTFSDLDVEGNEVGTGTWSTEGETICFIPDATGEEEERCWINDAPDADGSFISRRVGVDESYRVTPLEE